MKQEYPSLLNEDVCKIPLGMVRERQEMIRHLRSIHTIGGETEVMEIKDLIYLLKEVPSPYPKYRDKSLEKRIQSVFKLTASGGLKMTDDQLQETAMAGFFYGGSASILTCYHCGCNAIDWQTGDDPWLRHAELQPNCPVIKRHVTIHQEAATSSFRRSLSCP